MKTTDIPKFPNVVAYFTEQIKRADEEIAKLQTENGKKGMIITGPCVGAAFLDDDTSNPEERVVFLIYLDDKLFQIDNPQDLDALPLASIVKIDESGYIHICINTTAYRFIKNSNTESIFYGLVAHELGHYLAGHLDGYVLPKDRVNTTSFHEITNRLLDGIARGAEYEIEANKYAIGLVGLAPVLANIAVHASLSANIGVRMEFSNQLQHFIFISETEGVSKSHKYTNLTISLLPDEMLTTAEDPNATESDPAQSQD